MCISLFPLPFRPSVSPRSQRRSHSDDRKKRECFHHFQSFTVSPMTKKCCRKSEQKNIHVLHPFDSENEVVVNVSIEGSDSSFGVFTALVPDESKATRLSCIHILGIKNKQRCQRMECTRMKLRKPWSGIFYQSTRTVPGDRNHGYSLTMSSREPCHPSPLNKGK